MGLGACNARDIMSWRKLSIPKESLVLISCKSASCSTVKYLDSECRKPNSFNNSSIIFMQEVSITGIMGMMF